MKKIIKNILILISYFFYEIVLLALLQTFGINTQLLSTSRKILLLFIFNLVYIIFLVYVFKEELKTDIKDFKENYKKYLSKYVCIYFIGIILMALSNVILQKITGLKTSGNESSVRSLIDIYPYYMFFSAVIYSPFVEEIIFRKSIKNIFKYKYLFIIISGFLFGILHISNYKDINEILMGIPYIIMGIDFAYIYQKSNNIFTTMSFHLIHNLLLFIIVLV